MNSLKNVTISLQSSLNMNRNESLTDSSFSIFNKQNSPVFGGSISPLHYKLNGTDKAVYTYSGDKFYIKNGSLYKNDVAFKDFNDSVAFNEKVIDYDLDGLDVVNRVGYEVYTNSSGIYLRLRYFNSDWTLRKTKSFLATGATSKTLLGSRIVERNGDTFVIVLFQDTEGNPSLEVNLVTDCDRPPEQIWDDFDFVYEVSPGTTMKIESHGSSVPLVSMSKKLLCTPGENSFGGNRTDAFGITVFLNRPSATNTFANMPFCNFEFSYNSATKDGLRLKKCQVQGLDGTETIKYKVDSDTRTTNRSTFMAFVDNTCSMISIGSSAVDSEWGNFTAYVKTALMSYISAFNGSEYVNLYKCSADQVATLRGGSYVMPAKFQSSCLTMNQNGYARLVLAGFGADRSPVISEIFDSGLGCRIDSAGVTSNADIPTNSNGWDTWWSNIFDTRDTCYNKTGTRIENVKEANNTSFCTLFNGEEGNITGISYTKNSTHVGTLLTEWGSVLESFGVSMSDNEVAYKDANTGKVKVINTKSVETSDLSVVRNKLIVRCSADENIYDLDTGKWGKFANDWNDRCFVGVSSFSEQDEQLNTYWCYRDFRIAFNGASQYYLTASFSTGFDSAFQKEKSSTPSRLFTYNQYLNVFDYDYYPTGYVLTDTNGLDIFISEGITAPYYKTTKYEHRLQASSALSGSVYPVTEEGSTYFNIPVIDFSLLDCYNGRYALTVNESAYSLVMSDRKTPVLLYNALSGVRSTDFFIVQGQNYAVVQGYICMLTYNSNGVITQVEQVVDVGSMTFLGAFPSCALFYSPAAKTIFAFNGDANLQIYVKTDRISEVYTTKYFPALEWICFCCNDGTYILTEDNNFRVELSNVEEFYNTEDPWITAVLHDGTNIRYSLVKHDETWTTIPVEVETAFFCDGDMKKSTITDWYIRVFKGDEDYNGKVICSAKTMNDIVSQTIKTFDGKVDVKLTKDKFDENDNSMITLHTGCNALGTSCKVVSDYPISYFGFTIGGDGSTAKSRYNI